jgi:hypothetical protein
MRGESMGGVVRSLLVLLLFALLLIVGVAHGLRGLAFAGVFILAWAAKDTRAFKTIEGVMIRITGSRRAAWITVLGIIIVVVVALDVFHALH